MTLYSHSRLSTYENCPQKYQFQYVTKEDVERRESVEAFLGSCVHESLEHLYRLHLNRRLLSQAELLDDFREKWAKGWHEGIFIVRTDLKAEHYLQQGLDGLSRYYDRYQPFNSDKTLALELRVEVDLDGRGEYRLQGFIDRLSETEDGHYQIHDYKTERNLRDQEHFDQDRQLALYQLGISRMFPDIRSVELIWHYLIFDKEIRSRRSIEDLEELKRNTIDAIRRVQQAQLDNDFPTRVSALCDWCDYFQICPAQRHMHITSELSPVEFKQDDGVRMVDRWVELAEILSETKAEKEELAGRLYDYCRQLGIEVVRGSDHKLKLTLLSSYEAKHSQTKNPEDRERFIQFLKERGLFEELWSYNHQALISLLKSGGISPELRQALLQYVIEKPPSPRFTVSKLRDQGGR